jgi:hypothetical protein
MSMMDSKRRTDFSRKEGDWPVGEYLSACVKCGRQFIGEKLQRLCTNCVPKPKSS